MITPEDLFHPLHSDIAPPARMSNPFCYDPHPLCLLAMEQVRARLYAVASNDAELRKEVDSGKMIGVLVVRNLNGEIGYLAAFSGQICGHDSLQGFVPPVFHYLSPNGYFKTEEARISAINAEIASLCESTLMAQLRNNLAIAEAETRQKVEEHRKAMVEAKARRDEIRANNMLTEADQEAMTRESQFMKAQLRRIKATGRIAVDEARRQIDTINAKVNAMKAERQRRSDALQTWLFDNHAMLNACGETKTLTEIFRDTVMRVPPSGSGECCEPRLLQYAFVNSMQPLCMAMMWVGASPQNVIRHDGTYCPACQGRCKPILQWMLKGLDVDPDTTEATEDNDSQLKVIYHDDDLAVVYKPAGMLSVPGKGKRPSVSSIMRERFPQATGPMMVHRLDMSTSGIMVIALNDYSYRNLQRQFAAHVVRKRYVAVLCAMPEGVTPDQQGTISLPLASDYMHRPCQMVDHENGKPAITRWIMHDNCHIDLFPETGRTHQLRVHCAHKEGLGTPIKGDALYGTKADRLYLHAAEITFRHPRTGKHMHFSVTPPFTTSE